MVIYDPLSKLKIISLKSHFILFYDLYLASASEDQKVRARVFEIFTQTHLFSFSII